MHGTRPLHLYRIGGIPSRSPGSLRMRAVCRTQPLSGCLPPSAARRVSAGGPAPRTVVCPFPASTGLQIAQYCGPRGTRGPPHPLRGYVAVARRGAAGGLADSGTKAKCRFKIQSPLVFGLYLVSSSAHLLTWVILCEGVHNHVDRGMHKEIPAIQVLGVQLLHGSPGLPTLQPGPQRLRRGLRVHDYPDGVSPAGHL